MLNTRLNLHPRADYHRPLIDRISDRKRSMISGRTDFENGQDYRGLIPQETFDRNGETFARLMGSDLPWNFGEAGPDLEKIARSAARMKKSYT
jgi:hypothetical protein